MISKLKQFLFGTLPNPPDATKYYDGSGNFSVPAGSGTGTVTIYSIGITIDGGGSPIITGFKGVRRIPQGGNIVRWTIMADQNGDIEFDVFADAIGTYPPTTSIVASAPPELTGGSTDVDDDTTLTGWDITAVTNDIMGFEIVSTSGTIERVTLQIDIQVP